MIQILPARHRHGSRGDARGCIAASSIQTQPRKLTVRLAVKQVGEEQGVWEALRAAPWYLPCGTGSRRRGHRKGPQNHRNCIPQSGKFQQVWTEVKQNRRRPHLLNQGG